MKKRIITKIEIKKQMIKTATSLINRSIREDDCTYEMEQDINELKSLLKELKEGDYN